MLDEEEAGPTGSNSKLLKEKKVPVKKEKTWKERGEIAPLPTLIQSERGLSSRTPKLVTTSPRSPKHFNQLINSGD